MMTYFGGLGRNPRGTPACAPVGINGDGLSDRVDANFTLGSFTFGSSGRFLFAGMSIGGAAVEILTTSAHSANGALTLAFSPGVL